MRDLRLMVYDRTCVGRLVGLSTAWRAGSSLYRALGRLDATFGAASWEEALEWLAQHEASLPIREIQYWGHGRWGRVMVDAEALDAAALRSGPLVARLEAVRERLVAREEGDRTPCLWLRTCEAFGADVGHDFARRLADFFRAPVAGHTHVIGAVQSGLHGLLPGHAPDWPAEEGISDGTAAKPRQAHGSGIGRPNTITCFDNAVPPDWFAAAPR